MARRRQGSTWRNVSETDRVLLWGRSAARCNHPGCKRFLVEPATEWDAQAMCGQAAHIVAHSDDGPRGDSSFPREKLDAYENLVLLCGVCHTIVDKQPNTYTVEDLRAWKEEHESWIRQVTEPTTHVPVPWIAVAVEDEPRIDLSQLADAVKPDCLNGEPRHLVAAPAIGDWEGAARRQKDFVDQVLSATLPPERRFAVFGLTRIPLAVQFGFLLGDRCRMAPYQYHRDEGSWTWPSALAEAPAPLSATLTALTNVGPGDAVIRVSLSATVSQELTRTYVENPIADVHLFVPTPSVTWLRSPVQLSDLAKQFRVKMEALRQDFGERCGGLHMFYAGPVPGAVVLGRAFNPRMNPPMYLYELDRQTDKGYERVLCLGEGVA